MNVLTSSHCLLRIKEGFTKAGPIERAVSRVGLEGHNAVGTDMLSQVFCEQLRASEYHRGGGRGTLALDGMWLDHFFRDGRSRINYD